MPANATPGPNVMRELDALYQNDRPVGRVVDAQVDEGAKQIRFGEIHNTDDLLLPDECEFQEYVILIKKIAHASKIEPGALPMGRVLKGVQAQIVGYREQ